jgi:carbon-monoxide dehydrogenase large subunit
VPGLTNRVLVAGAGTYVDDVVLPGMTHLAILRSPYAHAGIRGIDTAEAERLPGVVCVVTGEEIQRELRPIPETYDIEHLGGRRTDWYALCHDRVRYVGEAVAAVVAVDKYTAFKALDYIDVDYEELPVVADAEAALAPDAPLVEPHWPDNVLFENRYAAGDVDGAFADADGIVRGSFRSSRLIAAPMEPRGCVVSFDPYQDLLTVWDSTQFPHTARVYFAKALGISENCVRVIQPHVGGSFGLKQTTFQEKMLCAYLARKLRRPVKWIEERREHFQAGGHARDLVAHYEAAYAADGEIVGLRVELVADVGALTALAGWSMATVAARCIPGIYKIANFETRLRAVVTNKCPWNAYRGFGKDAAAFVMERILDKVSRATGVDRAEIRLRNVIQPHEFPFAHASGEVIDSGNYPETLRRVLELIGRDEFDAAREAARARGERIGLGFGLEVTPEGAAFPNSLLGGYEGATVRLTPTGDVLLLTGTTSAGTGNETALAQIAADVLSCPVDRVRVVQGDTDTCPWGLGNFASRAVTIGGTAVHMAATAVREKLLAIAAAMLDVPADQLSLDSDHVLETARPDNRIPVRDVVCQAYEHVHVAHMREIEPALQETRYFRIGNVRHEPERDGSLGLYPTWSNGAAACVVAVDADTGLLRVLRYCYVHDAGRIVNPLLAEAQIHGGIVQGIGGALYEHVVYDDAAQIQTGSFMDYTLPTAVEAPTIELEHLETPSPFTPMGTKGVGESGLGAAVAAICSAVEDAFPELDLDIDAVPATPNAIWRAVARARQAVAAS